MVGSPFRFGELLVNRNRALAILRFVVAMRQFTSCKTVGERSSYAGIAFFRGVSLEIRMPCATPYVRALSVRRNGVSRKKVNGILSLRDGADAGVPTNLSS